MLTSKNANANYSDFQLEHKAITHLWKAGSFLWPKTPVH